MLTKIVKCIIRKNEQSCTGGPLQTSRPCFFNLFNETLVILSNIKSFHPAAEARGLRGATERGDRQRALGANGEADPTSERRVDGASNVF